jgi:hypothetical protein
MYSYVAGDPVNYNDSEGLFAQKTEAPRKETFCDLYPILPECRTSAPHPQPPTPPQPPREKSNGVKEIIRGALPDGRTISVSGSLGVIAGVSVSGELVFDYHTGTATLVASAGMAANGGGASASVLVGYIFGSGNAVPNYTSGGNTTVSATLPSGVTAAVSASSGGITGNPLTVSPVSATAVQAGFSAGLVSLLGGMSGSTQNTVSSLQLGSFLPGGPAAGSAATFDTAFFLTQQICDH